ncbi:hypothetical protein MRB53_040662 [Persea americana]|nr:hypothetical protein MRB53_040662 [Persea americana]
MSDPRPLPGAEKSSSRIATVKRKDSAMHSHDESKSEESLSTTPKQSQSLTGLHAQREASQGSSSVGQGGDSYPSIKSNTPLQVSELRKSTQNSCSDLLTDPRRSMVQVNLGLRSQESSVMSGSREHSTNLSYAFSEADTASGLSASEYSSGDEEGERAGTGRSGTIRGRPAMVERSSTYLSQASNTSKATAGPANTSRTSAKPSGSNPKRRPSLQTRITDRDRSKARRGSLLSREQDNDEDDDNGRFGPLDDEDDEVEPHDRGEELVRRRMKQRAKEKAAKKKAEKEKEKQIARRQGAAGAPLSPRFQAANRQSMAISSSPRLEREGQPTFISIPGQDASLSTPALSPLLTISPGIKGALHYPSPHSHIRRPSAKATEGPTTSNAVKRASVMSSTVGPQSRAAAGTPQPGQGQDVFSEAAARSGSVGDRSYREDSLVRGVQAEVAGGDDDDEERDTVAGLATDAMAVRGEPSLLDGVAGDQEGVSDAEAAENIENEPGETSPSLSGEGVSDEDVEYTLKDRQDAINIEHPFGLPIWKPALYKKSRTVTRNAESALHSIPAQQQKGIFYLVIYSGPSLQEFGSVFLAFLVLYSSTCSLMVVRNMLESFGAGRISFLAFWKICRARYPHDHQHTVGFNAHKSNNLEVFRSETIRPGDAVSDQQRSSGSSSSPDGHQGEAEQAKATEYTPLKGKLKGYGTMEAGLEDGKADLSGIDRIDEELGIYGYVHDEEGRDVGRRARMLGTLIYGLLFWLIIAPLMGIVCLACWGLVFPIPMAKLTWVLLRNLSLRPLALHFRSAPRAKAINHTSQEGTNDTISGKGANTFLRLRPGQFAPRSTEPTGNGTLYRRSKILVCTYRAMGLQYYKYTVGGVNILFINTLPFVFFTIFDFFFVEPYVHKHHLHKGFLTIISSQQTMFVFALGSVIPLSYFIGMAVASISAQSSIGMGAVINATFGSIIEIILYAIALTQHKARLVEGSIIGSILAGVLLMPGISMCSGATRRKEQRFNARSAGVTSTMLIMAIIGILTPTLFYQIYGTFQLTCQGCPEGSMPGESWTCKRCFYEHVPPATDPFYQENVKGLMYTCTVVLVLSYGIGLWFSLRTHASQIWQNPQPVAALPAAANAGLGISSQLGGAGGAASTVNHPLGHLSAAHRGSIYKRLLPASVVQQLLPSTHGRFQSNTVRSNKSSSTVMDRDSTIYPPLQLPEGMSQEEYDRAVAMTANAFQHALRHEQQQHPIRPLHAREGQGSLNTITRNSAMPHDYRASTLDGGANATSAVLYAIIAEILVDAVDVVLEGSGLDLKLLGVTLFALVPNATEFMNAMSFAINGNIALSMEIGSAYALQVCLIQIPAMVAFSAFYNVHRVASVHDSFTLIFPRWDVIAIIFAIFLLTYTYIEARSNYFRGALCILSYVVLVSGFVFAPNSGDTENPGDDGEDLHGLALTSWTVLNGAFGALPLTKDGGLVSSFGGLRESIMATPALIGLDRIRTIIASLWYR